MPKTLFAKIWDDHVVHQEPGRPDLLYIDRHLVHEVTSPQAFEGLRQAGRPVRRPDLTTATLDHNIPTVDQRLPIADRIARKQVETLRRNCREFGVTLYDLDNLNQGIVHVIGPELGLTRPGLTMVCGDSHTSTHGAFGALAIGIGTSEVEHVLATQCLIQSRPRTMRVHFSGKLSAGVTAKDVILYMIRTLGTDGAVGHVIEYAGPVVEAFSMEERMTLCNMSIEGGARAGMVAPDETTFEYLEGRPCVPRGKEYQEAVDRWRLLPSDPRAEFHRNVDLDCGFLAPQVSWGTNPGMVVDVTGVVPDPEAFAEEADRESGRRALDYRDLDPGTPVREVRVDRVFIGSCTNSRIEDLRSAARVARGRKVDGQVYAMWFPVPACEGTGRSGRPGPDFIEAGFDWRESGCSMCLGMNPDVLQPGQRLCVYLEPEFRGPSGEGRTGPTW